MKIFHKKPKKIGRWSALIIGGIVLGLLHYMKKNKIKNIGHNFKNFLISEEKEAKEFTGGQENFKRFCGDAARIFKDFFIPHRGNNHKPKILRPKFLTAIAVALIIIKASVTGYLFIIYPNEGKMSELMAEQILILTNESRVGNNLKPLNQNPDLAAAALNKAEDMIKLNYFAHIGPEGKKPWDWIDQGRYSYVYVGENLGMNFSSAESVHNALMASLSHKKNILNANYKDIGLAVLSGKIDGQTTNILVELFGAEKSLPLASAAKPLTVEKPAAEQSAIAPTMLNNGQTSVLAADSGLVEGKPLKPADTEVKPVDSISALENLAPETAGIKPLTARLEAVSQSPNAEIENNLPPNITYLASPGDSQISFAQKLVNSSRSFYYFALIFISAALLINILIKIRVQHKSVIFQSLILILLIVGLLYFHLHILENINNLVAVI